MVYHKVLSEAIENKAAMLTQISDQIWEYAETKYEEVQSAELMGKTLQEEGFKVQLEAGGIHTAVVGESGKGGPVIGILGEYDALPNLSQKEGYAIQDPIVSGGNGHGCGHNLLGVASLAAAISVKEYIDENKLEATVRYYGCPAEEGGGGKAHMAKAGLFDDVDIALSWHPGDSNGVNYSTMLATSQIYFTFHGKSSHAGAAPHLGRSALDAVELMNVGVNFLREHVIPEARLHYAITNTGGNAPNVVQNEAEVLYKIRAPQAKQVQEITNRVVKIAEGAALMTETSFEMEFDSSSASLIPNKTLADVMYENFKEIGTNTYTTEEEEFAKEIQKTFGRDMNKPFNDKLEELADTPTFIPASTDVGDVSWLIPTGQVGATTVANGTPGHSWQLVAQGKSSVAHKGMLLAGKVIAASAIDLILNPEKIEKAKIEHKKQLNGGKYLSLIPNGTVPQPARK